MDSLRVRAHFFCRQPLPARPVLVQATHPIGLYSAGHTILTVIPSGASSAASVLTTPTNAGRNALDSARLGMGARALDEPSTMIRPYRPTRSRGIAAADCGDRAHHSQLEAGTPVIVPRVVNAPGFRPTGVDHEDIQAPEGLVHDVEHRAKLVEPTHIGALPTTSPPFARISRTAASTPSCPRAQMAMRKPTTSALQRIRDRCLCSRPLTSATGGLDLAHHSRRTSFVTRSMGATSARYRFPSRITPDTMAADWDRLASTDQDALRGVHRQSRNLVRDKDDSRSVRE